MSRARSVAFAATPPPSASRALPDRSSPLTELQGLDLNPGIKGTIVQIGWRQEF